MTFFFSGGAYVSASSGDDIILRWVVRVKTNETARKEMVYRTVQTLFVP